MSKDYKKLYEESIERARDLHDNHALGKPFIYETCEYIFPELHENENEKIRKQILSFLKEFECDHYRNLDFSYWIAWLEKQGEQKSWSEEDEKMFQFWNLYYEHKVGDMPNKNVVENLEKFQDWLKSLKQKMKGE